MATPRRLAWAAATAALAACAPLTTLPDPSVQAPRGPAAPATPIEPPAPVQAPPVADAPMPAPVPTIAAPIDVPEVPVQAPPAPMPTATPPSGDTDWGRDWEAGWGWYRDDEDDDDDGYEAVRPEDHEDFAVDAKVEVCLRASPLFPDVKYLDGQKKAT
ncbi:MAG: hypothetical protein ACK46X_15265, partial [Candidatus Sericytochromatia bacterium]